MVAPIIMLLKQQTKQQCESSLSYTRKEALKIQEAANNYSERSLIEVENKLKEMSQLVVSGKLELGKIKSLNNYNNGIDKNKENNNPIPIDKAAKERNIINRIRNSA